MPLRSLPKPRFYSQASFINQGSIKDQKNQSSTRGNTKKYHEINFDRYKYEDPFRLIQPRSSKSLCNRRGTETKNNIESSFEILGSGMILLKNYISLNDQVAIVNICEKLNGYPASFMNPIPDGEKLGLSMMLLGLKWKVPTAYDESELKRLMVPYKFISLVNSSIHDSQSYLNSEHEISSVCSNNCAVKFYTDNGEFTLHEDSDHDNWYPYEAIGWPVVSMHIGDSAEFFCNDSSHVNKANKVLLESGDVLIFGNNSRNIVHGLHKIIPDSAPLALLKKSMLRPGVLNLSFREF